MIAIVAVAVACVGALAGLWRLVLGPTLYDRALAANLIVVMTALASAAMDMQSGPEGGEVSLVILFCLLIADIAFLRFVRLKSFQPPFPMLERGE